MWQISMFLTEWERLNCLPGQVTRASSYQPLVGFIKDSKIFHCTEIQMWLLSRKVGPFGSMTPFSPQMRNTCFGHNACFPFFSLFFNVYILDWECWFSSANIASPLLWIKAPSSLGRLGYIIKICQLPTFLSVCTHIDKTNNINIHSYSPGILHFLVCLLFSMMKLRDFSLPKVHQLGYWFSWTSGCGKVISTWDN